MKPYPLGAILLIVSLSLSGCAFPSNKAEEREVQRRYAMVAGEATSHECLECLTDEVSLSIDIEGFPPVHESDKLSGSAFVSLFRWIQKDPIGYMADQANIGLPATALKLGAMAVRVTESTATTSQSYRVEHCSYGGRTYRADGVTRTFWLRYSTGWRLYRYEHNAKWTTK